MTALRKLSARPTLVVDNQSGRVVDPSIDQLGFPGPFGRHRVIKFLPTNGEGPVQLVGPLVVHDANLAYLADPQGNLIGVPGIWVHRLLPARWVEDTRRIAG